MALFTTDGATTSASVTSVSGLVATSSARALPSTTTTTTTSTLLGLSEQLLWINESVAGNATVRAAWSDFLVAANESLLSNGAGAGSGSGSGLGAFGLGSALLLVSNSMNETSSGQNQSTEEEAEPPGANYSLAQIIFIALLAAILSITTVVGNFMVLISFKMDKQLQTISNYFLLSLAVADFAIGLVSMPLYTVYLLLGYWPFGALLCDVWLSLDYLLSNASVLNLLIISFDRYFSVTRPLTYRARRTTRRAIFMISCAWVISLILWPPWIFAWPYIEGKRTVEKHKCYIQFLKTNLYITFGTAIAAFYIPVSVMCILYWQIWRETEKRQKDLTNLQVGQGVKKDNSKRSTSSDDVVEQEEFNKRSRSDSSTAAAMLAATLSSGGGGGGGQTSTTGTSQNVTTPTTTAMTMLSSPVAQDSLEIETTYVPTELCVDNPNYLKAPGRTKSQTLIEIVCSTCYKYCKIDREPPDADEELSTSDAGAGGAGGQSGGAGGQGSPGNTTPASAETPVQSSVSRCTSLTFKQHPDQPLMTSPVAATMIPLLDRPTGNGVRGVRSTTAQSLDSVYTILIRLPLDNYPAEALDNQPSIRMIAEEEEETRLPLPLPLHLNMAETSLYDGGALIGATRGRGKESPRFERECSQSSEASTARDEAILGQPAINALRRPGNKSDSPRFERACSQGSNETSEGVAVSGSGRRISQPPETIKLPLNTKLVPKQTVAKAVVKKKKKKTQERKQDRKAAKTLSAILLAFIITWTPYNILVLVQTLAYCGDECVPNEIWDLVYYLCYINSLVNPLCYALCNASFRRTYVRILTCKWHTKKRNPNRGYYN